MKSEILYEYEPKKQIGDLSVKCIRLTPIDICVDTNVGVIRLDKSYKDLTEDELLNLLQ
jgi:hypothetical protein